MAHAERQSPESGHRLMDVTVHVTGHTVQTFEIDPSSTLLGVMEKAARLAGLALLPPRQQPFDQLHSMDGEQVGKSIQTLDQTLTDYLRRTGQGPHFTLELMRTFRVNTRWDVAPHAEMSPREILALPRIHLEYTQYTLYLPESAAELPLDKPIKIERGTDLEAQADGKYGGGR